MVRTCPRCGTTLAFRGQVWGCMNRFCTYERAARPGDLTRLIRDVTRPHRPLRKGSAR